MSPELQILLLQNAALVAAVAERDAQLAERDARLAEMEKRLESLERLLRRNSSNSSAPPSSDKPNAPRPKKPRSARKRGAQKGHKGTFRALVEVPDGVVTHGIEGKCRCGSEKLTNVVVAYRHQISEIPELRPIVTEHQVLKGQCACCKEPRRGILPADVSTNCLGPRAQAHLAVMAAGYLMSKRDVQKYAAEMLHLHVSLGTVSNNEAVVSQALGHIYHEASNAMSLESHQNVDETGFQRNGTSTTTWIKTNLHLAVLSVGKSRRRSAFKTFVGWRYDGMVTSDRYAVYDAVAPEKRQLCWAHILRVFKALVDEGDQVAVVGSKLLQAGRLVIRAFNRWRDQRIRRGRFDRVVGICRRTIENLLSRNMELPGLRTLAHAFILTSSSVWLFTTDVGVSLGIEPTNNLAERDLRRFVLWKKRSFFSQSRRGDRFMERAMTIVCSCRKQGRDLHEFVVKAVVARKSGLQKPSLIRAV